MRIQVIAVQAVHAVATAMLRFYNSVATANTMTTVLRLYR